jgi:hypothetical protein
MGIAREVAEKIRSIPAKNLASPESFLERILAESVSLPRESTKAQWMIALQHPKLRLFLLQFVNNQAAELIPDCREMGKFCIAGDNTNCAIFWAERYHKKTATTQEAIFLAAHLMNCSELINPSGIEGLEIAVCTEDGIRLVPDAEIAELKLRATENDRRIGELVCSGAPI